MRRPGLRGIGCLTAICLALLPSTARGQTTADTVAVTNSLARYASLAERMASDSIGALYLDDGEMAGTGQAPVKGPKAISAFLHTFDAYRVLSETMTSDRLRFRADTAIQGGNFVQRVQLPAGDTVVARGTFEVTWVKSGTTGWRVRRMTTGPAPVN